MPTDLPYAERDPLRCFRGACYVLLPADGGWFNTGTRKHYCETCASLINRYTPGLCVPPGTTDATEAPPRKA